MNFTPPVTTIDRFALTLDLLLRAVAARVAHGVQAAMILMIWGRIRRIERTVEGLLARFLAGRLRVGHAAQSGGRGGRPGVVAVKLPRRFGWLLQVVPFEGANFASQLRVVLAEPQMVALLEASPQAGRVLRPLCRMLGLEPEVLAVCRVSRGRLVDARGTGTSGVAGAVVLDPVRIEVDQLGGWKVAVLPKVSAPLRPT